MAQDPLVKSQRVFFALWPDAGARVMLSGLARETAGKYGGRPTRPELLHLTLAFLGNQSEPRVGILRQLASGIQARSFVLSLDQLGAFRHAGVAWLGASAPQPDLERLQRQLVVALEDHAFLVDGRPYAPHLTLTRHGAIEPDSRLLRPISWRVASFALVESLLGRDGLAYRSIAQWPLAAADEKKPRP